MKDKTKKIIYGAIDIFGYSTGITLGGNVANLLLDIWRDGYVCIRHTWLGVPTHKPSLAFEIAVAGGFVGFCIFKCINGIIKRDKRLKD